MRNTCHAGLHSELEASLSYRRTRLRNKTKQNTQDKKKIQAVIFLLVFHTLIIYDHDILTKISFIKCVSSTFGELAASPYTHIMLSQSQLMGNRSHKTKD